MIKAWFTFTKGEKYGIAVLALVLFAVIVYPFFYQLFFFNKSPQFDMAKQERVDSFFNALIPASVNPAQQFSIVEEEAPTKKDPEYFPFDPNTASVADFIRMGFSQKQAQAIERFRIRGAKFRTANDFARVYVVDSVMFNKLKPYISIPPADNPLQRQAAIYDSIRIARERLVVELNSADTLELVKLRGIGRGFARRIANHRTLLGGYFTIEQLTDIYGITPELIESIRPNVKIDTFRTRRFNLNLVSYSELRVHPYLNDHQARAIIYYREKKGNFVRVDELLEYKLLDTKTFEKVRRYFVLN